MIDGKTKTTAVPRAPPPTAFTKPKSLKLLANDVITDRTTRLRILRFVLVCISSLTENKSSIPSLVPIKGKGYVNANETAMAKRQIEAKSSFVE